MSPSFFSGGTILTLTDGESLAEMLKPARDTSDGVRRGGLVEGFQHEFSVLGSTSLPVTVCLFVQGIVGGGLLTYPYAYRTGGVLNMLVVQGVLLVFVAGGLWVLAKCTDRTGAATYQALVRKLLGRNAELACELLIVVLIFGASVVYLDICVDQLHPFLAHGAQHCHGDGCGLLGIVAGRGVLTAITASLQSLLCLRRTMTSLSLPSLLGFGALLYVCFLMLANYVAGAETLSAGAERASDTDSGPVWVRLGLGEWLSIIPVVCFSYQGHISAVPLYYELRRRSMRRWNVVVGAGLGVCVLLYNVTGFVGYLQFGTATQSDVLKSFSGHEPCLPVYLIEFARVAVAIAVSVTSAVFTFCARSAILDELSSVFGYGLQKPPYPLFLTVTCVWVVLIALVAMSLPDIGVVVALVGNICAFFMFHFPGLCMIAITYQDAEAAQRQHDHTGPRELSHAQSCTVVCGWVFIALGSVVFALGMASSLGDMPM